MQQAAAQLAAAQGGADANDLQGLQCNQVVRRTGNTCYRQDPQLQCDWSILQAPLTYAALMCCLEAFLEAKLVKQFGQELVYTHLVIGCNSP